MDVEQVLRGGEGFWDEFPAHTNDEMDRILGDLFAPDALRDEVESLVSKDPARDSGADAPVVKERIRHRPRSRFTNAMAKLTETMPVWWEDLDCSTRANAAMAWMGSIFTGSGAKLGGVTETTCGGEGGRELQRLPLVQVWFSSEEGRRWLWVCPELLAHLQAVRLFRPMGEALLGSLRAKARLWAVEKSLPMDSLVAFLPGTLALAVTPTPDEVVALGSLRGSAGQWSVDVLGAFARGKLQASSRGGSWWDVLRPSLRFGGTRGSFLSGAGCAPLTLPA